MKSILILLHCESNTGYAIGPLELTFFEMAMQLCDGNPERIHFGYPSMARGPSPNLPSDFKQYVVIDAASIDKSHHDLAAKYIKDNCIDVIFGFDQPVSREIYKHFRDAGVNTFISYWGAPMSSLFGPLKLLLKQLEVRFHNEGPDHYVFESHGMAETAVRGRGISPKRVSVVHLGVDTNIFRPCIDDFEYVYKALNVPRHQRIFFYAGHMEERKGVSIIMEAANELAAQRKAKDWQILLFGNKNSEESPYLQMLSPEARPYVTFGGYRNDLNLIQRGCYAAIIASTGWDSFPRSGIEMQASGLPLLASNLPGLKESIIDGETGFLFETRNASALAARMAALLDHEDLRNALSLSARKRITEEYSIEAQVKRLAETVNAICQRK
jgi:glycosyltransferase involved in cell wall biosynthesis